MDQASIVIVGGGVVGCAIAASLAEVWGDVFLLEKLPKLGMGASSRNSGVLHSGLYYPQDSLKAKLCVEGNRLAYEFCATHNVPHRRTGKLVVATQEGEESELERLASNGRANGVEALELISREAVRAREPHLICRGALFVPSTGIVAAEELVKAFARVAARRGANIVTHAAVARIEPVAGGLLRVASAAGEIEARCLVNAAGLYADEVAAMLGSSLAAHRIYPLRGEYCELLRAKSHLVNGLVYPLPRADGLSLGMHLTRTLWDTVLVGPTARYVDDKTNYERDREPAENFFKAARVMLPELESTDLALAYSGLRARLVPPGETGFADFIIRRDSDIPAVIHLIGIDSPGLTSAPAIARLVRRFAAETLS